jgi:hypothetical protein
MTRQQLVSEARALPTSERQELIEDLRQLEGNDDLSSAQRADLERRVEKLNRGDGKTVDGALAMQQLLQELVRR